LKINVKEATVTSNLSQDDAVAMTVSAEGMEHIMGLLTNLYKDPELAVIREYFTNGLDAHTAAGVSKPVKVTLPTWDDPSYRVTDEGVGMSVEDINKNYAQYGASTKRKTNKQLGAFGLGCKSALAITQQFTLITIKDGFKTTALISKTETGINTINIITSLPTTEANGTTVQIPVKSINAFNRKAQDFFAFSKPGTVLVDGLEPVSALDVAKRQTNPADPDMEIYVKPKQDGESYVLMGPVPYALSQVEIEASLNRLDASTSRGFIRMPKYFKVPIGSVELTPSREGLRFTDKTNEVIDAHMSFLVNDLRRIAQEDMDTATNLEEFWEKQSSWNNIINVGNTLKGEEVPNRLPLSKEVRTINRSSWSSSSHYVDNYIGLKNYGTKKRYLVRYSSEDHKKINGYLTPYLTSIGKDSGEFVITDAPEAFDNKWIKFSEGFELVSGDLIIEKGREQRKKERAEAAKLRGTKDPAKIQYPVLDVKSKKVNWVEYPDIPKKTPYISMADTGGGYLSDYIRGVYRSIGQASYISDTHKAYFESVTKHNEIILLNSSRTVTALEQRVPTTFSLVADIKDSASKIENLITDDMSRHHAISASSWSRLLKKTKLGTMLKDIKDPDIVGILEPNPALTAQYDKYNTLKDAMRYFCVYGATYPKKSLDSISEKSLKHVEELDDRYPLVAKFGWYSPTPTMEEHAVKYLNMVYAELNPKP
jgi:hypothetical protein